MSLNSVIRRVGAGAFLAALALLAAGCDSRTPEAAAPVTPPALARVGTATLTEEDLVREVERRRAARRPLPEKEALVREMAEHLALAEQARALGLDRDPSIALEIRNLLIRRLLDRELTPRLEAVEVTDPEIEAEYQRTVSRYTQPAKDRLAVLFLEVPLRASDERRAETRRRMEEARRQFQAGVVSEPAPGRPPGFGPMSLEFSDDQASRHRGGDLGWLDSGNFDYRWPRPVLETGYALAKGAVSEVIEAERGFYLVLKTDTRPALSRPLSEVAASIRQSLLAEKRRATETAYRRELAASLGMTLDSAAIAAAALPEASSNIAQRTPTVPPALPGSESHGR